MIRYLFEYEKKFNYRLIDIEILAQDSGVHENAKISFTSSLEIRKCLPQIIGIDRYLYLLDNTGRNTEVANDICEFAHHYFVNHPDF